MYDSPHYANLHFLIVNFFQGVHYQRILPQEQHVTVAENLMNLYTSLRLLQLYGLSLTMSTMRTYCVPKW